MELLLPLVVFGLVFYFVLIRPQSKRMKEHQEMVSQLEPGSRVALTSGIFGTILHTGERQAIIELAPGVEVTVMKGHIAKVVTPDEEEFEFEDEAASGAFAADEAGDGPQQYASDDELRQMFDGPDAESTDEHRGDETNR